MSISPASSSSPNVDARQILQQQINGYVRKGFRVVSQSDLSAQLVKPKRFSFWWALLWFLVLGVGLLVYLFYYAAKRDQQVYLTVDPVSGRLDRRY